MEPLIWTLLSARANLSKRPDGADHSSIFLSQCNSLKIGCQPLKCQSQSQSMQTFPRNALALVLFYDIYGFFGRKQYSEYLPRCYPTSHNNSTL